MVRVGRRAFAALAIGAVSATVAAGCSASRAIAPPTTLAPHGSTTSIAPSTTGAASSTNRPPTVAPTTAPAVVGPGAAAATTAVVTAVTTTPAATTTAAATTTTFAGIAPTSTLPAPTPAEWGDVDDYLQSRLTDAGDYAFSVAVSIDGVPVHAAAFGTRNHPDIVLPPASADSAAPTLAATTTTTAPALEPVTTDDRFRIASLSKMLTGTVVLQLVQDGHLQLDQAVGGTLGSYLGVDVSGTPAASITVRQLLSHTSGFGVYQNTFFGGGADSCPDAVRRGLGRGLEFAPGTTYNYSNMNFCALGVLIEAVTGQNYLDAVYQRLLTPLGITGMRLAGTFDRDPLEVIHPSSPGRNYMEVLGPAGGWVATPQELVRIVDALDDTKPGFHPLSDSLTALMRKAQPGIAYRHPNEQWYGLATIAYANGSWGHTGTIENTHAMVVHRPDGMTWAITVSGNVPDSTEDLAEIFQDALDHAGIDAPAPTTTTTTTTSTTTTTLAAAAPTTSTTVA